MSATYRDSNATVGSGTSLVAVLPTYIEGDVLVMHAWGYTSLAVTGWTERLSQTFDSASKIHKIWTKTAGASESNPTITHGVSDQVGATITSVSSADTASPIDGTTGAASVGFPGSLDAPSITDLAGTDSLLICGAGVFPPSAGDDTFTPPTGMTEREDFQSWDYYSLATLALTSSAATGTKTFTPSNASGWGVGSSIAIKSAAAGGSPNAESAAATGTANDAQASVGPTAVAASAAGAGQDATTNVASGVVEATATALAQDAVVQTGSNVFAQAETATAVAEALFDSAGGSISLELTAENPIQATALALDAETNTADKFVDAQTAMATATAHDAGSSASVSAEAAQAIVAAETPSPSVAPHAATAEAVGTALDATAPSNTTSPNAENAVGVATANDATTAVAPEPAVATAAATAHDATVTVSATGGVTVPAEVAEGAAVVSATVSIAVSAQTAEATAVASEIGPGTRRFSPPDRGNKTPYAVARQHERRKYAPWTYFAAEISRPINVWVRTDGTITEQQPANWSDVRTVYLGGHVSDITEAEYTDLVAAGYATELVVA